MFENKLVDLQIANFYDAQFHSKNKVTLTTISDLEYEYPK